MTGKELFEQMLALGGKTQWVYPYEPSAKYPAANRALLEVNGLFPVTETVQILHYPILPCVYEEFVIHKGGEDIRYNARGIRSLAFAVSGTGEAHLISEDGEREHVFSWEDEMSFKHFSGIVEELTGGRDGEVHLTFSGDYNYMIKDLSLYEELGSPLAEDVSVYSPLSSYDLKDPKYAGERFLAFDELPIKDHDPDLILPQEIEIEGSILRIPKTEVGVFDVRFRRKPREITADNEALEIDLDPELHLLVALKAAAILYSVSDTEIADRCEREFQNLRSVNYSQTKKVRTPKRFRDVRGW